MSAAGLVDVPVPLSSPSSSSSPSAAPAVIQNPSSMKAVLNDRSGYKPVLRTTAASDPAIDYIGRWDDSKTARWAGSSLRFSFTSPLLFLVPGEKTRSTEFPTLGWTIDGISYTAQARPNVSLRLWPPEGGSQRSTPPTPLLSSDDHALPPSPSTPTAASSASSSSAAAAARTVEITLLDWGSVFQVSHVQTLRDSPILPAYPDGIGMLPTMLFIGDSITSGFIHSPHSASSEEYAGFMDAYPAHLRALLSPGARIHAVAFPGIKLVDEPSAAEGMESKWFKAGPMEDSLDWEFEDRDDERGPTHIFVNLGTNDHVPSKEFLETYEGFLHMLKETHGRRTGDIFVIEPFGVKDQYGVEVAGEYTQHYPRLEEMVQKLKHQWEEEDPLASGDFPSTPLFELTKLQLESPNPSLSGLQRFIPNQLHSRSTTSTSSPSIPSTPPRFTEDGLPSPIHSPRPSLIVRPSSIAAISPAARGTKARLHYIPTKGWLTEDGDTFDGVHPTRKGAVKLAKKLRNWLRDGGFLADL